MLLKLTTKGKLVLQIGRRGQSTGPQDTKNVHGPADVFVYRKTNEVFVGDEGNLRVIVFDADTGAFKRMWSAFGNVRSPCQNRGSKGWDRAGTRRRRPAAIRGDARREGFERWLCLCGGSCQQTYSGLHPRRKIRHAKFLNGGDPSNPSGLALSADPEQRFMYVAENETDHLVVVERKSLEVLYQFGKKSAIRESYVVHRHFARRISGDPLSRR